MYIRCMSIIHYISYITCPWHIICQTSTDISVGFQAGPWPLMIGGIYCDDASMAPVVTRFSSPAGMTYGIPYPSHVPLRLITGWWFGTFGLFFHILGKIIPTDELIFFKGVDTTNQISTYNSISGMYNPIEITSDNYPLVMTNMAMV